MQCSTISPSPAPVATGWLCGSLIPSLATFLRQDRHQLRLRRQGKHHAHQTPRRTHLLKRTGIVDCFIAREHGVVPLPGSQRGGVRRTAKRCASERYGRSSSTRAVAPRSPTTRPDRNPSSRCSTGAKVRSRTAIGALVLVHRRSDNFPVRHRVRWVTLSLPTVQVLTLNL